MVMLDQDDLDITSGVEIGAGKTSIYLLDKIWSKIGSDKQANSLIGGVTRITRRALNASAAGLFLVNEESEELILKFASGRMQKQPVRFKIDTQSGIPGWVARVGRAVVTNAVVGNPRYSRLSNKVYGFVTKSLICVPLIVHRKVIGVIEVANKASQPDFSQQDLQILIGVANTVALTIENVRLNECLQEYYKSTVNALVSLADAKEITGCGHSKRVAEYALKAANWLSLPAELKQSIEYAAILHDIGKLAIPDAILNKPSNLTDQEREIMCQHPQIGHNLIKGIPFLEQASYLVLYHHERFDGTGYPCHVKGRAIPIGARLIAVADAFDNMTTSHAYRDALDIKQALIELNRHVRTQFCPVAIKAFFASCINSHSSNKK